MSPTVSRCCTRSRHDIALGLAGLANILDPAVIVVSGGLVDLGDLLLDPVREAFGDRLEGAAHRPPVPIVPAELGDQAGVVGAAVLAASTRRDGAPATKPAPKLGITLPSFVDDPAVPIGVARAAEAAGLDGVFVFDHLFRRSRDGSRRPALEGPTLLAAVAAATERIHVGVLVVRGDAAHAGHAARDARHACTGSPVPASSRRSVRATARAARRT